MKIDKTLVKEYNKIIKKKKELWENILPNLKFDEQGRCLLNNNHDLNFLIISNYFSEQKMMTVKFSFLDAFNSYLKDNGYEILLNTGKYEYRVNTASLLRIEDLVNNMFYFKNKSGKILNIKASRILAGVQEYWLKLAPEYENTCKEIKLKRDSGLSNKDKELIILNNIKKEFEKNNLYFEYQNILNQGTEDFEVYLSINPLDVLSSSGNGDRSNCNPTTFETCIYTNMRVKNDYISVETGGQSGNPKSLLHLNSILNRGIIFVKNGKELPVPNTDFSLLGYKGRIVCWLDSKGLWLEKMYPFDKTEVMIEILKYNNIPLLSNEIIGFKNKYDMTHYLDIQDKRGIKKFNIYTKLMDASVFLDKVAIHKGKLLFLPMYRKEYGDSEDCQSIPKDYCSVCNYEIKQENDYRKHNEEVFCPTCYRELNLN